MAVPIVFPAQDSFDDLKYGSQGGSVTGRWFAYGSDYELDAFDAVLLIAPRTYLGFIRQEISPKRVGPYLYKVEVTYSTTGQGGSTTPAGETPTEGKQAPGGGQGDDNAPLDADYTFDTSPTNLHISQSIATVSATKRGGGDAPDFKHAIGVTRSGVAGCDIFGPQLEWSRTVSLPSVSLAYIKQLMRLTGTANTAPFYTFGVRDVLFKGASGKATDNQKWTVTYKFSVIETQTNIVICDGLTVPQKRGWEYIWFAYEDTVLSDRVAPLPIAAYVEQVVRDGDFSILRLDA